MNKEEVLQAIKKVRESSKKRKFSQSFDLLVHLQDLNLKNPEENVSSFAVLKFARAKKVKICAFIDKDMKVNAEKVFDSVVLKDDFKAFDKKKIKLLAGQFDYFVAQANLMAEIAKHFGKVFGPKGKMPNPKAGCVVPPNVPLEPLYDKLQRSVKLQTKNEMGVKCSVGDESMEDEKIAENVVVIYNHLIALLPGEEKNIKKVYLKLTMGGPVKVGK